MTFQVDTVTAFARRYAVAGRVVCEIGSDPHLLAARKFIELGAAAVIATNLGQSWFHHPVPRGVIPASCDIRRAADLIGARSVDIVFGINVLEHIHNLDLALASITKILRPEGVFLLHGHPIWSCATGHHLLYDSPIEHYSFQTATNPIPPWAHLYMNENELSEYLSAKGVTSQANEEIIFRVFSDARLNRMPLSEIDRTFSSSSLVVQGRAEDDGSVPMNDFTRERMQKAKCWSEIERYSVRQLYVSGTKRDQ